MSAIPPYITGPNNETIENPYFPPTVVPPLYATITEDGKLLPEQLPDEIDARLRVLSGDTTTLDGIAFGRSELAVNLETNRIEVGNDNGDGGRYDPLSPIIASEEALTIEISGSWLFENPTFLTSPDNLEVFGTCSKIPGKWITAYTYNEYSITTSSIPSVIQSLEFPDLVGVTGTFSLTNMAALTTLSLPALKIVGGQLTLATLPELISLDVSELIAIGTGFAPNGLGKLGTLNFPSLESIAGSFAPTSMTSLTAVNLPLLRTVGTFGPGNLPALTTLDLPSLQFVGAFTPSSMAALTTLSASVLTVVGGNFSSSGFTSLTILNFPSLTTVGANFNPSGTALVTLNFPLLNAVGGFSPTSMNSVTTLNFPSLRYITSNCNPTSMTGLTTLTLSAMINYNGTITIPSANVPNLVNITLGTVGTLLRINGNITLSGLKLNVASVNDLLALLVSLDGTNGTTLWGSGRTLLINGGTNAAPTGQGIVDKATLIARGATITTN